jgi:hypothetical protein
VLRPPAKMGRREFTKREKYLMGLTKSELVGTYRLLYGGIQCNMVGPGHSHARLEGDELRLTSKRMRIGGHEGHTKFVWKRVGS